MNATGKGREKPRSTPKNFVISFRVNADEWEVLRERSNSSGVSVSTLLRSCIDRLMQENHREL